jgi:hypothetical protein
MPTFIVTAPDGTISRHTKYRPARLEQVRVSGTLPAVPADVEAV